MASLDNTSDAQLIEFEGFRLDQARRRLLRCDGGAVALRPQIYDLLAFFLAHAGEILDRQTIIDGVWPRDFVDENNLNQAVSALRGALGESRDRPRFLVTVPRRGYQFIAKTRAVDAPEESAPTRGAAAAALLRAAARRPRAAFGLFALTVAAVGLVAWLSRPQLAPAVVEPSIAVLAFTNISADPDQEYFSDGVSEEILNQLAQINGLRVTARSSSFAFKGRNVDVREIGAALDVAYVLEGGVRRDDEMLRVTAQLIDAADGRHIWSQAYDQRPGDVLAIQEEIARNVAAKLGETFGLHVAPEAFGVGTTNVEAWDLYRRGVAQLSTNTADGALLASDLLREAVNTDPEFLEARLALIGALIGVGITSPVEHGRETWEAYVAEIDRAEEVAPNDWRVIQARLPELYFNRDWATAAEVFERANALAPPSERACDWIFEADIDARLACARAREAVDPISRGPAVAVQGLLFYAGRYDEAAAQYQRIKTLPGDESMSELIEIERLLLTGGDRAAIATHFDRYLERGDYSLDVMRDLSEVFDDPDAARAVLRRAVDDPAHRTDSARQALYADLATTYGDPQLTVLAWRKTPLVGLLLPNVWLPRYSAARHTPEFKQLLEEIGLADYWRARDAWISLCRPLGEDDFECD